MPEYRGNWLFAQHAMKRRARQSEVRAVHITDPSALTPLGGRRLLATVYDLIPLREGLRLRSPIAWAGYQAYVRALRRVDILIPISGQTANELMGFLQVPEDRVFIAPPGIDLPPGSAPRDQDDRPYFLFVGGPNPNKNLATLLDALAICYDLEEELLIAGRWLPNQVAALTDQLKVAKLEGRVRHLGFVPADAVAALMAQASALVIPSLSEGFGLPVGEGLAAGALVLHSRIPVLTETSAGAALTFDPRSAAELASCLRRAVRDNGLSHALRKLGVERAKQLTWDVAVERTLAAYRRALAK
jgi:glycosyltransferase involved in cell wall biosynthesis